MFKDKNDATLTGLFVIALLAVGLIGWFQRPEAASTNSPVTRSVVLPDNTGK